MKDRVSKFKKGKMNSNEIINFKEEIDLMTDEELDEYLNECESDIDFTDSDIDALQNRLNEEIKEERRKIMSHRFYKICAAVMLPVILLCGVSLVNCYADIDMYETMVAQDISIGTDNGESAMTILPDGSKITMGPKSNLTYNFASFNQTERHIRYSGEGRFSIKNNPKAPFFLLLSEIEIKVLGTVFSVYARENKNDTEIFLEEGSLQLTSFVSDCQRMLSPGETAIIHNETGEIEIIDDSTEYKRTAGQNIIYFKSASLTEIANELSTYYDKEYIINSNLNNILFTGSLPTNDLEQVIFVLDNTLNITIEQDNDTLTFLP